MISFQKSPAIALKGSVPFISRFTISIIVYCPRFTPIYTVPDLPRFTQQNEDAAIYLQWLQQQPLEALNPDDEEHKLDSVSYLIKRSLEQVSAEARDILALAGQVAMSPFDAEVIRHSLELSIGAAKKTIGPLVNYGLLNKTENRYQISHALIHTYARQKLPLQKVAWQRLANWYIELTNTESSNGAKGFQTLDQDRAHLLRLVEGCEQRQEWKTLISLVQSMDSYLDKQGYWIERSQLLHQGLTIAVTTENKGKEGWFYAELGHCCIHQGDYDTALDYLNQSLAIQQEIGDVSGLCATLFNMGHIYWQNKQQQEAVTAWVQAYVIAKKIGGAQALDALDGLSKSLGQDGLVYWETLAAQKDSLESTTT